MADIVVGAPMYDDGRGSVYVFFGGPGLVSGSESDADRTFRGGVKGDLFGGSVAAADVMGDGIGDVIAGADQGGRPGLFGQVYVFPGGSGLKSGDAPGAPIILTGETADAGFGIEIAVGDLTGEGIGDLAVATNSFESTTSSPDKVYVFFGGPAMATDTADNADRTVRGEVTEDHFGAMLRIVDVSGGPVPDLIVAAPGNDAKGKEAGRVYVFEGGDEFPGPDIDAVDADVMITGELGGDFLGPILPLTEISGDGIPDLFLSAPMNDAGGTDAGRVYVFLGGPILTSLNAGSAGVIITGSPGQLLGIPK